MNKCKNCIFYDEEYDNSLASDVISDKEQRHYCILHSNGITSSVWNGEKKCSDYTNENINNN
jgi:hypothetical protein